MQPRRLGCFDREAALSLISYKASADMWECGTRGTRRPPADRPSGLLKGTIRGSLFHPEWPFVPRCVAWCWRGNVISHRLNGPCERTGTRTHTHTQVRLASLSERGIWRHPAVLQWAALPAPLHSERALMSCGRRFINSEQQKSDRDFFFFLFYFKFEP